MGYNIERIRRKKSLSSDLRHRITFQNYSPSSPDGEGGFINEWVDVNTVWAAINPIKAEQKMNYESISDQVTHLIKVRGNIDCNAEQRIKFGNRYFEIETTENIQERDIEKTIICREIDREVIR